MSVIKLKSGDELGWLVEQYDKTILQFSADWCGPCRRITPVVKDKIQELNDPRIGYRRGANFVTAKIINGVIDEIY